MSIILFAKRENEFTKINLQWTLDNSNYYGTEEIVRVEGRVWDTESCFSKTSEQETGEFVWTIRKFGLRSIRLAGS